MSKFLNFTQEVDCWIVTAKKGGGRLGQIEYYKPWKKWVYWSFETTNLIYDAECLKDIAKFMEGLQ